MADIVIDPSQSQDRDWNLTMFIIDNRLSPHFRFRNSPIHYERRLRGSQFAGVNGGVYPHGTGKGEMLDLAGNVQAK